MAKLPMYAAMVNSPGTEIAADINETATEITVLDASKLPAAPNLVTVGSDETAETILYTGKTGNTLTGCTRGFEGTAKGWAAGSPAARNHTAYDYEAGRANIADLDERVDNIVVPDASLTEKGIVQLSDATDGARDNVAATEKAINDAIGAAATDATTKATNAQAAAKTYTDGQVGNLHSLVTTAKGNTVAAINELFQSVSDGKNAIAAAITGKGVPASGGDTFPQLTTKIGEISTGAKRASGTATSSAGNRTFSYGPAGDTSFSLPFIQVSGLGFRPSRIIITELNIGVHTVYSVESRVNIGSGYNFASAPKQGAFNVLCWELTGTGTRSSDAYVNDSSFLLHVPDPNKSYKWEAFQV